MAEINISNLGGGGGGTLTLTTTGTGGASTYVAGVLNIPVYQSQLTNPVTGTGTATRVAFWDSASSVSSSANLYWDNSNSFLGVGTATPGARLQVNGTGLLTSTAFAVKDSGGTDSFTVRDNGNTSVRGVLTITGSSASNSATLMGRTSTGEVASVTLGTNLSFSGNTLNATSGGITSLNGLTAASQSLVTGTAGADFNISSATSTHTFNLPTASATNRGALSSADWNTFNNKQDAITNPVTGTGTATRVAFWNTASSVSSSANLYWDSTNSLLGIGTTTPGARLQVNGTGLTSGTTGLSVKDSGGTDNFTVADNGATFVRGVLTISGSSASNSATLMGRTSTGEVTSVTLGTNLSFSGNTLNATGGGTPAGSTGQVQFNNAGAFGASSNFNWDNTNSMLGIRTATPGASLQINGAGATSGTSSLLINNSGSSELFRVSDNGLISVGKNVSVSTQSSSQIQAVSGDAATSIVITPKGNGAFIFGPAPDGTTTGGNARGTNAIDFQINRTASGQVASGFRSVLMGDRSTAGAQASVVISETSSTAAEYSGIFAGSGNSTVFGSTYSFIGGGANNTCSASYSQAFGNKSVSNLYGGQVNASGIFSANGDAQTMQWRYRRSITGTGIQELTLDGAAPSTQGRAILVANRAWNVRLSVTAICSTAGGTVSLGDSYIAEYIVGIKRITNTTTLIGTVQSVITAQSDASMSSSVVTITADDTNESLKVEFTPPTTAAAGTVIRVIATATATVAGY